jgi:hypothetical protein
MQEIVASLLEDIAARNDALASACIPHLVAMVAGLMRGLDAGYVQYRLHGLLASIHPSSRAGAGAESSGDGRVRRREQGALMARFNQAYIHGAAAAAAFRPFAVCR